MRMEKLAEKLKRKYPLLHIKLTKPDEEILHVRICRHCFERSFSSDTLYVGTFCELERCAQSGKLPLHIFVICERSFAYHSAWDADTVIETTEMLSPTAVAEEILDLLNREQRLEEHINQLAGALFSGADMRQVIRMMAKILSRPVLLDNPMGMILFQSGDSYATDAMRMNHDNYHSYYEQYRAERYIERVHKNRRPVYICGEDNCPFLITGIKMANGSFVYLVIYEGEKKFQEEEIELIIFLKDLLPVIEKNHPFLKGVQKRPQEQLLLKLLAGKLSVPALEDAELFDRKLFERCRIICIRTERKDKDNIIIPFVQNRLQCISPNSLLVFFEGHMVMLLSCVQGNYFETEEFKEITSLLSQNYLQGGISREVDDFRNLRRYFMQAVWGLNMGRLYDGGNILYFYEKYAHFHMLETCITQTELVRFIHPTVLRLYEIDRKNHTEYLVTLTAYLYCGKNKTEAAELLGVNRKTVLERLSKIKENFNLNVEETANEFHILHSCKILEFLKGKKQAKAGNKVFDTR